MTRGQVVMRDGALVGSPGHGVHLKRGKCRDTAA